MKPDKLMRIALWISVPFNLLAAYGVAIPASWLGQAMGLPMEVPAMYSVLLAWVITLFAAVYAWLALQKKIDRPMVVTVAIAKTGVFVNVFLLWVAGHGAGMTVLFACGDLVLAGIFFWWLVKTARYANK